MEPARDTRIASDLDAVTTIAASGDPSLGPLVCRAITRRRFAVLGTASAIGRSHSAGILYQVAEGAIWVSTLESSRKARNLAVNPRVALTVPVRRLPIGPPSSAQIQTIAAVVALDDPELHRLAGSGALKRVTSHGEMDLPGGCFLRLELPRRVPVYGLGMSLYRLAREPLAAGRVALVDWG
ncbi:MAG TPA: pyridoxamine 5'-phosphate oxidase family protein [Acidimicrobiales bacterium]